MINYTCNDCIYRGDGRCRIQCKPEFGKEYCRMFCTILRKKTKYASLCQYFDGIAKEIAKYRIHIYAQEHGGIDHIKAGKILDEVKQELMEVEGMKIKDENCVTCCNYRYDVGNAEEYCIADECNRKRPTNGDHIRQMSNEEIAKVFALQCPKGMRHCPHRVGDSCFTCWLDWLNSEYEEGEK